MKITAILAVRNERAYLYNCLSHLIDNGLDFILIDNGSTDGTYELLQTAPFKDHMVGYIHQPYSGFFDWKGLMETRELAAKNCDADWVLFVSADEIMHSYVSDETLADAINRVAVTGADVIDFNEFVFLPLENNYVSDIRGAQDLRHYYFYEPRKPRLMRARRRDLDVSHVNAGGHVLDGCDYQLASESFALRHYVFRDQDHAIEKYTTRVFSPDELKRGWHHNRHEKPAGVFTFPSKSELHKLSSQDERLLDRSKPLNLHYWEWPDPIVRFSYVWLKRQLRVFSQIWKKSNRSSQRS